VSPLTLVVAADAAHDSSALPAEAAVAHARLVDQLRTGLGGARAAEIAAAATATPRTDVVEGPLAAMDRLDPGGPTDG